MLVQLSGLLAGKAAAVATGAVLAGTAVTGATGNLPAPVQTAFDGVVAAQTEPAPLDSGEPTVVEEPATEEPAIEEPATEEPVEVVDQPVPPTEETAPATEEEGDEPDTADVEDEAGDGFGAKRSAAVKAAREAGQQPGPAWADEAHPVFGTEGSKAGQQPGAQGRAQAEAAKANKPAAAAPAAVPAVPAVPPVPAVPSVAADEPSAEAEDAETGKPQVGQPHGGGRPEGVGRR